MSKIIHGIQKNTMEAKAYDIRGCGANDGLRGTESRGNGKLRNKTPNLLDKSHHNLKFSSCKVSSTGQKDRSGKHD